MGAWYIMYTLVITIRRMTLLDGLRFTFSARARKETELPMIIDFKELTAAAYIFQS